MKIKQQIVRTLVTIAVALAVLIGLAGPAMASGAMRVDANSAIGVYVLTCGGEWKYIQPREGNMCVKKVDAGAGFLMYYKWGYGTKVYVTSQPVYVGGSGLTVWNVVRLA